MWSLYNETIPPFVYAYNIFSPDECKKIINFDNHENMQDGLIKSNLKEVNLHSIRKSKITWLKPNKETEWIYRRLTDAILALNDQFYKFDIWGLNEGLQLTKYESPDGHYDIHTDIAIGKNFNGPIRKLSITIQLSEESSYEGGELELYFDSAPIALEKNQGMINMFPSYVLHKVNPVTKGTRYSLVAWVTGPKFI
jgi:PKHD-type hydroxylase